MTIKTIHEGTSVVRMWSNNNDGVTGPWNLRLFVNGGEDATLITAKTKTLKGAIKSAQRILEERRARQYYAINHQEDGPNTL
jgi:hypothetical protein